MKYLSTVFVVATILLLFSPIWLQNTRLIKIQPLAGSYIKVKEEDLNIENWFSTAYQNAFEENLLVDSYLSPFFIRLFNQMDYSFFDKVHMSTGVLGKENYAFAWGYINAYIGKDTVSDSIYQDFAYKFKFVSDTLEKLNKHIVYVQCPGKASYYPEYFPDTVPNVENLASNYYRVIKILNEHNVTVLDLRKHIVEQKGTFEYPMFTQTGIHWSEYSMPITMDTIVKFLNIKYGYKIPNIEVTKIEEDYAKGLDTDIEDVMNLLYPIKGPKYGYPEIKFPENNKEGVKMLMISDSYLGNLYWKGFHRCFQEKSQFWFYNKSVICDKYFRDVHVLQMNYIEEALKHDLILISGTEPAIPFTSWGFIDDLYYYFKDGTTISEKNKQILQEATQAKRTLKADEAIDKEVQVLIKKYNISYDSALFVKCLWDIEKKKQAGHPAINQ